MEQDSRAGNEMGGDGGGAASIASSAFNV